MKKEQIVRRLDHMRESLTAYRDYIDDFKEALEEENAKTQALTLPDFTGLEQKDVYGFMCFEIIELFPDEKLADENDWPQHIKAIEKSAGEDEDLPGALFLAVHCAIWSINKWRDEQDDEWLERRLNQVAHTSTLPIPIILTAAISFGGITDYMGEESQRVMVAEKILKDYGYVAPDKERQKIKDLEECLAGFMAINAGQGGYLDPEMIEWVKEKLQGKKRTPIQVWQTLYGME